MPRILHLINMLFYCSLIHAIFILWISSITNSIFPTNCVYLYTQKLQNTVHKMCKIWRDKNFWKSHDRLFKNLTKKKYWRINCSVVKHEGIHPLKNHLSFQFLISFYYIHSQSKVWIWVWTCPVQFISTSRWGK